MIDEALEHFKSVDPLVYQLALTHKHTVRDVSVISEEEYFHRIVRTIVGQQLSVKATATIWGRVVELLNYRPGQEFEMSIFDAVSDDQLRTAGLSFQKIGYIRSIIESMDKNEVNFSGMANLTDDEVVQELTKLKGIGVWSAEMFMMFALGRTDVFSAGDLGLMSGAAKLYGLDRKTDSEQIIARVNKLSPYRTVASLLYWQSLDNEPT